MHLRAPWWFLTRWWTWNTFKFSIFWQPCCGSMNLLQTHKQDNAPPNMIISDGSLSSSPSKATAWFFYCLFLCRGGGQQNLQQEESLKRASTGSLSKKKKQSGIRTSIDCLSADIDSESTLKDKGKTWKTAKSKSKSHSKNVKKEVAEFEPVVTSMVSRDGRVSEGNHFAPSTVPDALHLKQEVVMKQGESCSKNLQIHSSGWYYSHPVKVSSISTLFRRPKMVRDSLCKCSEQQLHITSFWYNHLWNPAVTCSDFPT